MTVHSQTTPRAVRTFVHAQGNQTPNQILADIGEAFTDFKGDTNGRINSLEKNMQSAVDDLNAKVAAAGSGNVQGGSRSEPAPDPEYSRAYASFIRKGQDAGGEQAVRSANAEGRRAEVQAAMSAGSGGDGGYLAPTEWDRSINKALRAVTPMRRIANVVSTGVRAYSTLWNTASWGSGWVGETASRPQTSSATLAPIVFDNGEIYAQPAVTQQLLDDAQLDIETWLSTEFADEFTKQEGVAFISGNGVNKPRGLLTYVTGGVSETTHPGGVIEQLPSGAAAAITLDGLINLVYTLAAPYRANAKWLMNSMTAAAVSKLKDAGGAPLWRWSTGLEGAQPTTLLGYPVEIDENMPVVAAGNLAVAFGDFKRGYLINDRLATRILRDPFTMKPYVLFYATKRVGGGVSDPNAIKFMKIAAS